MEYDIYLDIRETFGAFIAEGLSIEEAKEATSEAYGLNVWASKLTMFASEVLAHEARVALGTGADLDERIQSPSLGIDSLRSHR